ncbi:MAG: SAM-dependent methyltransferase [Gammaproteobacteria bacterium]|nr:SAM-dependent methyltransferase [Gammaproteobacteria bacterium]
MTDKNATEPSFLKETFTPAQSAVYIAHPDFLEALCAELQDVSAVVGNIVISPHKKRDICFAADVWLEPHLVHFESISEAVKILRRAGKYWFLNPIENVRRSRLIEAELKKLPDLNHRFPLKDEIPAIGCFSLLDKNTLIYSAKRWKKPPLGDYLFQEDKKNPPNRAYLKLWEALALLNHYPKPGDTAMDLGASPGGWSYVLQSLGAKVTAVDKAPLEQKIAALPLVSFLKQSAFALDPHTLENPIDWLLCDVACYPNRTLDLVQKWIASGKAKNMIITIKLQGDTDFEILEKFQAIPNARVIHLIQNKHEATFFYPAAPHLSPDFAGEI